MPSPPDLFDDEDGFEPDHESAQRLPARRRAATGHVGSGGRGGPNYCFRRAVVVGGVVAVLATASIVVGRADRVGFAGLRRRELSAPTGTVSCWSTTAPDASSSTTSRARRWLGSNRGFRAPLRPPSSTRPLSSPAPTTWWSSTSGPRASTEFDLGAEAIVRPSGSALTMIAPDSRQWTRALLVHGPSGDVIDTDTFAPVVGARYEFDGARSSPSGRDVLVTDSGNFQSVLISFDRDEPSYFPGLALAVDADLVVTAQNVGSDATINVFDHAGEPITTGSDLVRAGRHDHRRRGGPRHRRGRRRHDVHLERRHLRRRSTRHRDRSNRASVTPERRSAGRQRRNRHGTRRRRRRDHRELPRPAPCRRAAPDRVDLLRAVTADDAAEPQIAVVDTTDGSVLVEASGSEPLLSDASGCTVVTTTPSGYDLLSCRRCQPVRDRRQRTLTSRSTARRSRSNAMAGSP